MRGAFHGIALAAPAVRQPACQHAAARSKYLSVPSQLVTLTTQILGRMVAGRHGRAACVQGAKALGLGKLLRTNLSQVACMIALISCMHSI